MSTHSKKQIPVYSQQDIDDLTGLIDATRKRKRFWLKFPEKLESLYNKRTARSRADHLFKSGFYGILVYNIFALTDYFIIHDVFWTAITTRVLFTLLVLIPSMLFFRSHPDRFWSELVESITVFAGTASLIFILYMSHSPYAILYHTGISIVIVSTGILLRLPFVNTLILFIMIYILFTALLFARYMDNHEIIINNMIMISSFTFLTLIGNYYGEKTERKHYLESLRRAVENMNLSYKNEELVQLSLIDPLTRLPNRRYLDNLIDTIAANQQIGSLACLLIDIDYFKLYNDNYGHQAGDFCLQRVAACLQNSLRKESDRIARLGGEEFIIILENSSTEQAQKLAGRVQDDIVRLALPHEYSPLSKNLTLSIGLSITDNITIEGITELIGAADEALYRAKEAGRDRICS